MRTPRDGAFMVGLETVWKTKASRCRERWRLLLLLLLLLLRCFIISFLRALKRRKQSSFPGGKPGLLNLLVVVLLLVLAVHRLPDCCIVQRLLSSKGVGRSIQMLTGRDTRGIKDS
jgi:peptidoglycan/LPS O-acetylase OafA/YrhL